MGALQEKTAVVTGGGMGIGEAVARRFASEGATVAILDFNKDVGEKTARAISESGGKVVFEPCDVSDPAQVERAIAAVIARCGHVHALVNCAGIDDEADFLEIKPENWDHVLAVNLKGSMLVGQAVARDMAQHGGGAIVNIASIDGHAAEPHYASYNASKSAIYGMTRTAAIELAPLGIRINSISPGYVDTPMVAAILGDETMAMLRSAFQRVPIRRMLKVEEIAAVCLFLVSDESSAVTGSDLIVDGGTLANAFIFETVTETRATSD